MAEHKVGDVVFFNYGYGRIVVIKNHWRSGSGVVPRGAPQRESGEQPLYTVRCYDIATGKPMVCPDDRCRGEGEGCAICGRKLWADQIRPITERDLAYYVKEGFITDKE